MYYNYDGLFGVYLFLSEGEDVYEIIRILIKNNIVLLIDFIIYIFNFLVFFMDYFYGLKELCEVEIYYDLLFEKCDLFLIRNVLRFDLFIYEFLMFVVDELYIFYGYLGYFNCVIYIGFFVISLNDFGD